MLEAHSEGKVFIAQSKLRKCLASHPLKKEGEVLLSCEKQAECYVPEVPGKRSYGL